MLIMRLGTLASLLSWSHHFESFSVVAMTWLIVTEYVRFVVTTIKSFPHSRLATLCQGNHDGNHKLWNLATIVMEVKNILLTDV
jgi:hypothetical protein